ncbi:MAG TPA: DUF1289 domain-containing protein [Candidatus Binatia bacterium]|nr:DUF1289 domain-containing protein [Candidatus Binatia bacterium]
MNVPSPCNGICQLDKEDICLGCFRFRDEIARWTRMTISEQSAVVAALKMRHEKWATTQPGIHRQIRA